MNRKEMLMLMYLNEIDILRKAILVIKKIIESDEYCTMDAINGVLLLLDAVLEKGND